jgi:indolepyruvate ferredoxin oxidoreductase, alpha subunit
MVVVNGAAVFRAHNDEQALLLGNEAIARGALEAGIDLATGYPGTPSSEIIDTFHRLSGPDAPACEYSVNEMVALEVAAGATIGGKRALTSMKHVGLNVAADALNSLAYTGIVGGLVIVTADDPSMHSSQNEQDNRFYAKLSLLPMLEPSSPAEAQTMTREAFSLSEQVGAPVLLRTTTRINHARGPCPLHRMRPRNGPGSLQKAPERWAPVPAVARNLRIRQIGRLEAIHDWVATSGFNRFEGPSTAKVGVITSGITYQYVRQLIDDLDRNDDVFILKLGATYPIPEEEVVRLLSACSKVLVAEELEPYLETEARAIAQAHGLDVRIAGKRDGVVPRMYELNPDRLRPAISDLLGVSREKRTKRSVSPLTLPKRAPTFCAGCPHRASFYAMKTVFRTNTYFVGDIGCYALGLQPPLRTLDTLLCMGASVSQAQGAALANSGQPIVAIIGDSTFFHGGLPGLANAVAQDRDLLLVIVDNRTTAMTGHQPNPGTPLGTTGEARLDIEGLVHGLGVRDVAVVDPMKLAGTMEALEGARKRRGIRVVISRHPCPMYEKKAPGGEAQTTTYRVDPERCRVCGITGEQEASCSFPTSNRSVLARAHQATERRATRGEPGGDRSEQQRGTAPCAEACPAKLCVMGFMRQVAAGRFPDAASSLRDRLVLPAVLGRVCHRPCEDACAKSRGGAALPIRHLKTVVTDLETESERQAWIRRVQQSRRSLGRPVAVVGSGPAGLAAAFDLFRRGYEPTIFERASCPGGMLSLCIPEYRLPRDVVKREIDGLIALGIELKTGVELGRDISLHGLIDDKFEAVVVAVGAWRSVRLDIEGHELDGVQDALTFLRDARGDHPHAVGRRVAVIGGGNAAIDAARTAKRRGAQSVEVLYRRSRDEMPAANEEIETALDEGIGLRFMVFPIRVLEQDGRVVALRCIRARLGVADESGRRRPVPIEGSEFDRPLDQVIMAVGQQIDDSVWAQELDVRRAAGSSLVVDTATGRCAKEPFFAAGDVVPGPKTVIDAIATGQRAAWGVDCALRGNRAQPRRLEPLAVEARSADGSPSDGDVVKTEAMGEASRCWECGLCGRCGNCIDNFGCPALSRRDGCIRIDPLVCTGCGVCAQLCPNDAIIPEQSACEQGFDRERRLAQ